MADHEMVGLLDPELRSRGSRAMRKMKTASTKDDDVDTRGTSIFVAALLVFGAVAMIWLSMLITSDEQTKHSAGKTTLVNQARVLQL